MNQILPAACDADVVVVVGIANVVTVGAVACLVVEGAGVNVLSVVVDVAAFAEIVAVVVIEVGDLVGVVVESGVVAFVVAVVAA